MRPIDFFIFIVRLGAKKTVAIIILLSFIPLLAPSFIQNGYLYGKFYFEGAALREIYYYSSNEILRYISLDINEFARVNNFTCHRRLYVNDSSPLLVGEVVDGRLCTENGVTVHVENLDVKSYHYAGQYNGWMLFKTKFKRSLFLVNDTLVGRRFFISLNLSSFSKLSELNTIYKNYFFIQQENSNKLLDLSLTYGEPGVVMGREGINSILFKTKYGTEQFWYSVDFSKKTYNNIQIVSYFLFFTFLLFIFMFVLYYKVIRGELYDIICGINGGDFKNLYQPIVDSRTNRIVGVEALARWHKDNVIISPMSFIPSLESSNCLFMLTKNVINSVVKDIESHPGLGWVSVNIGIDDIVSGGLFSYLKKIGFPLKGILMFEITERQYSNKVNDIIGQINKLIEHGYSFKIDDFGTGVAGFSYINNINVNTVKIDKSFIDEIGSEGGSVVLDSLINIIHSYGLEVIAEGVESRMQADHLMQKKVYLHQGYFYAKPMPISDINKGQYKKSAYM